METKTMKTLIEIYSEDTHDWPGVTGYLMTKTGWEFLKRGDLAIARLEDTLRRAIEFLEGVESSPLAATPEQTCLPKPRPCPPYYEIQAGLELASVIGGWSFNLGAAAKYIFRAGKKPGNRAQDDLAKAVDHLLKEIQRLDALDKQRFKP